jgi:RecQ-mediated genome instability protein 1
MAGPESLTAQVAAALYARHGLAANPRWLASIVTTTRTPAPPLAALASTAHFRLLNADITAALSASHPTATLPPDISDVNVKERKLAGNVAVQVLDVEDVGASKWSQVEAIERVERGEEVRGREVIRALPAEAGEGGPGEENPGVAAASSAGKAAGGRHRYVLQDAKGTKVVAFENVRVPQLGLGDEGVSIGMKVVLKSDTLVRRGTVMLGPENVVVLGGKVEAWDKAWKEGRKERLKRAVERESGSGER